MADLLFASSAGPLVPSLRSPQTPTSSVSQVIGAVAKGIGNIFGLGGSKHSSSKQEQQRSQDPSPDRRTQGVATSAAGADNAYPARDYNAWQAREVARGYAGVQNQEGWGGGRGGAGDWDDRRDRDQVRGQGGQCAHICKRLSEGACADTLSGALLPSPGTYSTLQVHALRHAHVAKGNARV